MVESAAIFAKGWSELGTKSFEAAKKNAELTSDFVNSLATAKNLSDVVALLAADANQ